MRLDRLMFILFLSVAACTTNKTDERKAKNEEKVARPKRIEYSTDTSFNSWDSLLLKYSYHPINRKLTAWDKEWYVVHDSGENVCGYVNMKGDTVIPMKYGYIPYVTDTFRHFAYVWLPTRGLVAMNKNEEILFEPHYFDNAPDVDIVEGLMRVERDNKVGFANIRGEIVIEPIYDIAGHFEKGYAWVGFNCYRDLIYDEHNPVICRQSGIINKEGNY